MKDKNIIKSLSIQNFKCFRKPEKFDFLKGTYFVGANNSGKSAVLIAVLCFFDDSYYRPELINSTELKSREAGYNKSTIELEFDLQVISAKSLRDNLIRAYGETLILKKIFTYREISKTVHIEYELQGRTGIFEYETLDTNVRHLLDGISISYIHPQESKELLAKAQLKLKERLLANWGRHHSMAERIRNLQASWDDLRKEANRYLSSAVTSKLQEIWPGSKTSINLPSRIEDIIAVSDISFKGSERLPEVSLTEQGTGAQSTILYQTHYLLDSDRTLHRGFYYPIWLLEEPESFLHADILIKLGLLLSSETWLSNIQMIISTHSPLILATSRQSESLAYWNLMQNHRKHKSGAVNNWNSKDVEEIGAIMGDPNFHLYFDASLNEDLIVIEDTRQLTRDKYREAGINARCVAGTTQLRRYFDVLREMDSLFPRAKYFIIDSDKGLEVFKNIISKQALAKEAEGFKKYKYADRTFLIVLPDGYSAEDLFDEFEDHLESCVNQLFDSRFHPSTSKIPGNLSRAHASIRSKRANNMDEAKSLIRNSQDIKDTFWKKVKEDELSIAKKYSKIIVALLTEN